MKIEKTIKIEISQEDVEAAIVDMIQREDPTIIVDEITFTPKRTGNESIQVKVDAHFGGTNESETTSTPVPTTEIVEQTLVEEVSASKVDSTADSSAPIDIAEAEPAIEELVTPKKVTNKTSLFG